MASKKPRKGKRGNKPGQRAKVIKVVANLAEQEKQGKRLSIRQAAIDAGYSEAYAKSSKLQQTEIWDEVMEEFFPDRLVAGVHQDQLLAEDVRQINVHYKINDDELEEMFAAKGIQLLGTKRFMTSCIAFIVVPDRLARDRALDKVYKIKRKYDNTIHVKGAISRLSDDELEEELASILSEGIAALAGKAPSRGKSKS